MKRVLVFLCLMALLFGTAGTSTAAYINFEDNTVEHIITDEYQSLGVLFSGVGSYSGRVFPIPSYGTGFFGNDGPWIMDIGLRNQATTATFVVPGTTTPSVATNFSVLMGDGNPDPETFTVTFFDLSGGTLSSQTYMTGSEGLLIEYAGPVASIEFLLEPGSASGACLDDFSFTPIPIPSAIWLLGTGLIGLVGFRRKFKNKK